MAVQPFGPLGRGRPLGTGGGALCLALVALSCATPRVSPEKKVPAAALIVAGAASTPADVERIERAFHVTFGVDQVEVLATRGGAAQVFQRTQALARTIAPGGRLWLGFVGE
ncbi:MAG: hypothetical protein IRZ16_09880, partial [Myxococcaceae bacterium]|nr:hypothetical protein [Myxococcaceae bacterium]